MIDRIVVAVIYLVFLGIGYLAHGWSGVGLVVLGVIAKVIVAGIDDAPV